MNPPSRRLRLFILHHRHEAVEEGRDGDADGEAHRAQAVADHLHDRVVGVIVTLRLVEQVAAELAHITDGRGIVLAHVTPEIAGAEFAAKAVLDNKKVSAQQALDKARRAYELDKLIQASQKEMERSKIEHDMAFASKAERDYKLDLFDIEQKILELKKQGVIVTKEQEEAYRKQKTAEAEQKKSDEERQHTFEYGWKKAYEEYVRNAEDAAKNSEELFTTMAQGMEDAIAKFIRTGKLDFKGFANLVLDEIARIEARLIASKIFKFLNL